MTDHCYPSYNPSSVQHQEDTLEITYSQFTFPWSPWDLQYDFNKYKYSSDGFWKSASWWFHESWISSVGEYPPCLFSIWNHTQIFKGNASQMYNQTSMRRCQVTWNNYLSYDCVLAEACTYEMEHTGSTGRSHRDSTFQRHLWWAGTTIMRWY